MFGFIYSYLKKIIQLYQLYSVLYFDFQRQVNDVGLPNDLDVIVNLCGYNILQPFKRQADIHHYCNYIIINYQKSV